MNCILKNLVSIFQSFRDHLSSKTRNAPWITHPAKYLIDVLVFKSQFNGFSSWKGQHLTFIKSKLELHSYVASEQVNTLDSA